MKKTVLFLLIGACVATAAQAETNVNVTIGVPAPRVVVPPPPPVPVPAPAPRVVVAGPPSVLFEAAPFFVVPPRLGIYVGVDTPYDIFFMSDYYYLYYGNGWYRARHHNGPWVGVPFRDLPPGLRKHRIERMREFREREYRVYHRDRDHYRGRYFRAGESRHDDWKEERKREKQEWKEERKREKREWKEERRHDREDRDDDRGHGRHGRD
jgi:hypothetical protein